MAALCAAVTAPLKDSFGKVAQSGAMDETAGVQVTRLNAAGAKVVLERLSGSDRLEKGAVFVLSVEAIRDRSPERWRRRCEEVWDCLNRRLDAHLSYRDIHERISDIDCLVAMTTEDGIAAQAVGMKVLEEVLHFFLGKADRIDIKIKSVGKIDGDELLCQDLDPAKIEAARDQSAGGFRRQVSPEAELKHSSTSFVAANGLRLQVDLAVEEVVSLRHGVTAVLRIEPTVSVATTGEVIPPRKFVRLADEDLAAVDRATLAFGALYLPNDARTQPPVILPLSFRTMACSKGRHALSAIEGVTPERVRQAAIVELVDIDMGTPLGRLLEVTGFVGQMCRGVLARVTPGRDIMAAVGGARLTGLTVDFSETPLNEELLEQLMRMLALQVRGKTSALIALGLPSARHLEVAEAAGFTHGALRRPATASAEAQAAA
jgi:hypothetical protein